MYNNSSDSSLAQQNNFGIKSLSKLLPIAIVTILTNGLVLVLFYRRPRLRTSSNYPLLSLAVCDFLTGAINIPYFIIFSFRVVRQPNLGFWMYVLHTLMAVSSAHHIFTIIAEKYLAIVRPLRHLLVTKKTMFKVLAGVWITSAFFAVIPIVWNERNSRHVWYSIHASVGLVFVFFVPYTFMIYSFIVMLRAIAKRERPSVHIDKSRLQQKNINDRKCVLVFATMATIFAVCWLPYFTVMLVIYLKSNILPSIEKAAQVFAITKYMTSISNPLLYTFFKRDFWLALRTLYVKGKPRFHLESRSNQRCQRWRGLRSTYSSTRSYTSLPENAGAPKMSHTCTKTNLSEQLVYITSV